MKDIYLEEYYKVFTESGKLLAQGKIINDKGYGYKNNYLDDFLISFDNRYFFKTNYANYIIEKCEYIITIINEDTIKENCEIIMWRNKSEYSRELMKEKNSVVFRDFSYDEIDEECKLLCKALNKLPGITTTNSCCGHNESRLYIDVCIKSFNGLRLLYNAIMKYSKNFILTTSYNVTNSNKNTIILTIKSNDIGETAYKNANILAEYLEKIAYRIFDE